MSAITAKYLKDINDTLKRMVEPSTSGGDTGLDVIFDETISGVPMEWQKNTDLVGDKFALSEWEMYVNIPSHDGWEFLEISSPGMSYYDPTAEADTDNSVFVPNYVSAGSPEGSDPGATVRIAGNGAAKYAAAEYIRCPVADDGSSYSGAEAARFYGLPDTYMTSVAIDANHILAWTEDDVKGIPEGTRVMLRGIRTDSVPDAYYSISSTLSNVSTSNDIATIKRGSNYSATLTVNEGYKMESVTVVMGASDITSTAYSAETGAITINAVSGDIVIAATAVAIKQLSTANLSDFFTVSLSHHADEPSGTVSFSDYFSESGEITLSEDSSDSTSWSGSWEGSLTTNGDGTAHWTHLVLTCESDCYLSVDLSSSSAQTICGVNTQQTSSWAEYVTHGEQVTIGFIPRESCTASVSVTITDDSLGASEPRDFVLSDATNGGIKLVPGNFGCWRSWCKAELIAKQDLSGVALSALYKTEKNFDIISVEKMSGGTRTSLGSYSGDSGVEASIWSGDLAKSDIIVIKYTKDGSVDAANEKDTYIRVRASE